MLALRTAVGQLTQSLSLLVWTTWPKCKTFLTSVGVSSFYINIFTLEQFLRDTPIATKIDLLFHSHTVVSLPTIKSFLID